MNWRIVFWDPPGTPHVVRVSGWKKVIDWVQANPGANGSIWKRVSNRPRSQRRADARGHVIDVFELYCRFGKGQVS